MQICIISANES